MDILILIIGVFMIGLGFLVKSVPDLISGYNTMPEEKKKNVDIQGMSSYMRNGMIIIGLAIIMGYYFFKWIGLEMIAASIILIVPLVGVIIMVMNGQKFDHNTDKKTNLTYLVLGIVSVFVIGLITYGIIPPKIVISNNTIRVTGMYGTKINIPNIEDAVLSKQIPTIRLRTNGFSFGPIRKGTYDLDKFGKCKLFLNSDNPPYLIISKNDGYKIIINFKDESKTREVYKNIVQLIDDN